MNDNIETLKNNAEDYFTYFDGDVTIRGNNRSRHNKLLESIKIMIKYNINVDDETYEYVVNEYIGTPTIAKKNVQKSFFVACQNFAGDSLLEHLFTLKKPSVYELNKFIKCMRYFSIKNLYFKWIKILDKITEEQKESIEELGYIDEYIKKLCETTHENATPLVDLIKRLHYQHIKYDNVMQDDDIKKKIRNCIENNNLRNNTDVVDAIFYLHEIHIVTGYTQATIRNAPTIDEFFIDYFGLEINDYFVSKAICDEYIGITELLKIKNINIKTKHIIQILKEEPIPLALIGYIKDKLLEKGATSDEYAETINNLHLTEQIQCIKDANQRVIPYNELLINENNKYILCNNADVRFVSLIRTLLDLYNDALQKGMIFTNKTFLHSICSVDYILSVFCMHQNVKPDESCVREIIKNNANVNILRYCLNYGINLDTSYLELSCKLRLWHFTHELLNAKLIPNFICAHYTINPHNKCHTKKQLSIMKDYGLVFDENVTRELILHDCYDSNYEIDENVLFMTCHNLNVYNVVDIYSKCKNCECDLDIYLLIKNNLCKFNFIKALQNKELHKCHYDLILEQFVYDNHQYNEHAYNFIVDSIQSGKYKISMNSINRILNIYYRHRIYNMFKDFLNINNV